ncbi:MAG: MBL fold metallo-hydrolase [Methylocystis sp.]|nr:MBL fold metallo-hydrolase [Methylocystis sp.]MCA3584312.1 MBL fold metallo-hydrolase [Methylocystis sp.]MCA3589327.1 MBL fold metallo-hydrolase [Methylocystis sp.]MCA3592841.1 MBL fold metallo-hydrolase [Methylocystis sp.]
MNRRTALKLVGLSSLAAVSGGSAYAMLSKPANPYYSGPPSDHFDGQRFFSPGRANFRDKSSLDLLRWQFGGGKEAWPSAFPSPHADKPPARVEAGLRVTLVGHATYLIQTGGLNIVIDPVWSDRASPVSFAGPRRVNAPGIALVDLPKIDAVLLTHNHYDHMDVASISQLAKAFAPRIIVPLGNDAILRAADPDLAPRLSAHDWGDAVALSDRVQVTVEPTLHWSARGLGDRFMALWANFVIDGPAGRIYACGDTGYDEASIFPAMRAKYGGFRLALLPIGAYEPRWFMKEQHMNPEEATKVFAELGAEAAIGHHWGTFNLTNEGVERPREALAVAVSEAKLDPKLFPAYLAGQVWEG